MVPKRKLLPCTMLHYSPWLSISSIWVGLKVGYAEKYDKVIPHFNDLGPLFSDKTGFTDFKAKSQNIEGIELSNLTQQLPCRMGWRFAGRRHNAQVSEVLTWHYQAVGGRPGG